MDSPRSFDQFWPYYLGEHAHPLCRRLHFIGTSLAFAIVIVAVVTMRPRLLLFAPVLGYGFSWLGHFGVERNTPAAFRNPLWSFWGDMVMWRMMATGRIDAELQKHGVSRS